MSLHGTKDGVGNGMQIVSCICGWLQNLMVGHQGLYLWYGRTLSKMLYLWGCDNLVTKHSISETI